MEVGRIRLSERVEAAGTAGADIQSQMTIRERERERESDVSKNE